MALKWNRCLACFFSLESWYCSRRENQRTQVMCNLSWSPSLSFLPPSLPPPPPSLSFSLLPFSLYLSMEVHQFQSKRIKVKDHLHLVTFSLACRRPIMMAIPTARAHSTPAVLYTKLLGVRYSSMCQLPVWVCVCVCVCMVCVCMNQMTLWW
jgi:hypothetical protein